MEKGQCSSYLLPNKLPNNFSDGRREIGKTENFREKVPFESSLTLVNSGKQSIKENFQIIIKMGLEFKISMETDIKDFSLMDVNMDKED